MTTMFYRNSGRAENELVHGFINTLSYSANTAPSWSRLASAQRVLASGEEIACQRAGQAAPPAPPLPVSELLKPRTYFGFVVIDERWPVVVSQ